MTEVIIDPVVPVDPPVPVDPVVPVASVLPFCMNCQFWKALDVRSNSERIGLCRVRAPQVTNEIDGWPKTTESAWCKEWGSK